MDGLTEADPPAPCTAASPCRIRALLTSDWYDSRSALNCLISEPSLFISSKTRIAAASEISLKACFKAMPIEKPLKSLDDHQGSNINTARHLWCGMGWQSPGKSIRMGVTPEELRKMFPDSETAEKWFEKNIWSDGRRCPRCGGTDTRETNHKSMPYYCAGTLRCNKRFSIKTGTAMEASRVSYQKWAIAICLLATSSKRVTPAQIHRGAKVNQKSARSMIRRLRGKGLRSLDVPRPPKGWRRLAMPLHRDGWRRLGMPRHRKCSRHLGVFYHFPKDSQTSLRPSHICLCQIQANGQIFITHRSRHW